MSFREKVVEVLKAAVSPAGLFLALYPLVDTMIPYYPKLGMFGFGWILIVFLLVCWISLSSLRELVALAREERGWLTIAMIGVWIIFLIAAAVPAQLLSDENIFQFGCPQVVFGERADYGFATQCFIGYPNRSYLLQALPVMLFGFSPVVANLGASAYLFPGIILFAHGVRILVARSRMGDFITGLSLVLLFQSTIFVRIIFYHDQTTAPIALTLSFIGLVVLAVWRESRAALFVLLALVLVSTAMYVPILAVLALLGLVLVWAMWTGRLSKRGSGLVIVTAAFAVVAFAQTLAYRLDLRLGVDQFNITNLAFRLRELWTFVLLQSHGHMYAEPILHVLFVGCVALGMCGVFGRGVFIFSVWAVVLVFASFFMNGMSPELAWWNMVGMHRAASIFPILIVLLAVGLAHRIKQYHLSLPAQVLLGALVVLPAIRGVVREPLPADPPLSYRIWKVAQEVTPVGETPKVTLITRNDLAVLGEIPKHYLYLDLDRTFEYYAGSCLPSRAVPPHTLVITIEDEICRQTPVRDGFQEVASWPAALQGGGFPPDTMIRVYKVATPKG